MKKTALVIMFLLLSAGLAWGKELEMQKKAGDLALVVKLAKNPPVTGDNQVSVAVRDATGKEVSDAGVKVEYAMPAMPGMPPMNYGVVLAQEKNVYRGSLNFSMAGPWNVTVKVVRAGKTSSAKFSVDVQ